MKLVNMDAREPRDARQRRDRAARRRAQPGPPTLDDSIATEAGIARGRIARAAAPATVERPPAQTRRWPLPPGTARAELTGPYPKRLVFIGSSGTGKTEYSRQIAALIGAQHIALDALYNDGDGNACGLVEFRRRVELATRSERWVVAGNYGAVRDLVWPRSETIVWLDFGIVRILWRLCWRAMRRGIWPWDRGRSAARRAANPGNSAPLLLTWRTYWRRRRKYPRLFARREFSGLRVVRLRNPREARDWFGKMRQAAKTPVDR